MTSACPKSQSSPVSLYQSPPVAVNVCAVGAGSTNALSESRSRSAVSNPQSKRVTVCVLNVPTKATYPEQVPAETKVNFSVKILNPENKKEQ